MIVNQSKKGSTTLPASVGDPLELVIVKESHDFGEGVFEVLKSYLTIDIGPSPQEENVLKLMEIEKGALKGVFKRHQNLLIISKASKFSIKHTKDLFAKEQVVIFLEFSDQEELIRHKNKVLEVARRIIDIDRARLVNKFKSQNNIKINDVVQKNLGIQMWFPKDFFVAHIDTSMIWLRRETPKTGQGVLIFNPRNKNNLNAKNLIKLADSVTREHVSGPLKDSYMTSEKEAPISIDTININNHKSLKIQSLWRMEKDFMGGVFNIYYLDQQKRESPIIYTYLYAPGEPKNIFMLQLDAIVHTLAY